MGVRALFQTCVFSIAFSQSSLAQATVSSHMFRENPAHLITPHETDKSVYDTRSWQFYAEAPVRSSVLVFGNSVYFGTTGGKFFSVDRTTGNKKWEKDIGSPVNSSAAIDNGKIFFVDNTQSVYAIDPANGKTKWKVALGQKLEYPWRFDYYYSSPVPYLGRIYLGADDGFLYSIDQNTGQVKWKYDCKSIIRSTPAIRNNRIYFGDMNGTFHALDLSGTKELWNFKTVGDTLKNEEWGFDRKAILSSPVITQGKIVFGCRDGFLYCLSEETGGELWKMNHNVSWVISTVAVKDSIVVTGTSDGRFVQAININSGREMWKFRTPLVVWSSPIIVGEHVYGASVLHVLVCYWLKLYKFVESSAE